MNFMDYFIFNYQAGQFCQCISGHFDIIGSPTKLVLFTVLPSGSIIHMLRNEGDSFTVYIR